MSADHAAAAGAADSPDLRAFERRGTIAAAAGLGLSLVGAFLDPSQFYRSYLYAYLFWVGVGVGCLSLLMIHHLTGGYWGLAIRRLAEAGTKTLVLAPVLFLPVALGLRHLYVWARPDAVAADPILQHKATYLNVPFFLGRAVFYFTVWGLLVYLLDRGSRELEAHPHDRQIGRRLRGVGGSGLVLLGLTITFSAVDWAMSLDPHWFSTIYGILFMVGQALSALSLMIVLVAAVGRAGPLSTVVRAGSVHDLGKLMLAFVMVWAYVNFSQFLIIWSGNLPEEIPWYIHRLHGGWQWVALVLVVFHFALPFLMLLSRDLKRDARSLALVAAGVFLVRFVDLFWLVAPELKGASLGLHWLDLTAVVGLGGVFLAVLFRQLRARSLLPEGEPELDELRAEPEAAH